jgi:ribose transport system permease protein
MTGMRVERQGGEPAASGQALAPTSRARLNTGHGVLWQLERFALVGIIVVLAAVFWALRPGTFGTVANVQVILGSQASLSVIALGALIPLMAGHFDLSVGAVAGLSGIACAAAMARLHQSLAVAIVLALAISVACGAVNGFVITRLRVDSFIATVGSGTIIGGLVQAYTGGLSISNGISPALTSLGSTHPLGVPRSVVVAGIAVLAVWYLQAHTPLGRHLYALGSNPRAARLVGIRAEASIFTAFVMSAMLGGIAGIVELGVQGNANPQVGGVDYMLPALAAVFLGATVIEPGRYNAIGTVLGLIFVAVGVSGLTLLGVNSWVQSVFNGAALIVAVAASAALRHRRTGSAPV